MSQHETIKRYYLIINLVKENQKPSKRKILEMLDSNGFNISKRTLESDIEDIQNELGIELVYDRSKNGYYIDLEESENLVYMLQFLELSISTQMMIDSLKEGKEALQYISFDSSDNLTGVHRLRDLFMAIKTHRIISFDHTSFQTGVTINYCIHPYLLKEYKRRWFLYGYVPSLEDFRIFGIERISNLILNDDHFKPMDNLNAAKKFDNIIGINLSPIENQPIQTIIISSNAEQGRYLKSLPWHSSFAIIKDDGNEFRFGIHVLPNNELIQLLLNYCNRITVESPQWLRGHLKKLLSESAAKY